MIVSLGRASCGEGQGGEALLPTKSSPGGLLPGDTSMGRPVPTSCSSTGRCSIQVDEGRGRGRPSAPRKGQVYHPASSGLFSMSYINHQPTRGDQACSCRPIRKEATLATRPAASSPDGASAEACPDEGPTGAVR